MHFWHKCFPPTQCQFSTRVSKFMQPDSQLTTYSVNSQKLIIFLYCFYRTYVRAPLGRYRSVKGKFKTFVALSALNSLFSGFHAIQRKSTLHATSLHVITWYRNQNSNFAEASALKNFLFTIALIDYAAIYSFFNRLRHWLAIAESKPPLFEHIFYTLQRQTRHFPWSPTHPILWWDSENHYC